MTHLVGSKVEAVKYGNREWLLPVVGRNDYIVVQSDPERSTIAWQYLTKLVFRVGDLGGPFSDRVKS